MLRKTITLAAAALSLCGITALAQDRYEPGYEPQTLKSAARQGNLAVRADVGVANYLGDLDSHSRAGPAWGVAVSADQYNLVGLELGYEGSRNPIEQGLAGDNAAVWRHGVSGLAKLGPTLGEFVRPYVGAGLGVSYVNANDPAEGRYRNDFMGELPLAAGIEVKRGSLTGGIRGTYRLLAGEEWASTAGIGKTEGSLASATFSLGGKF